MIQLAGGSHDGQEELQGSYRARDFFALAIFLEEKDSRVYGISPTARSGTPALRPGRIASTLPFLIANFHAVLGAAVPVVAVELAIISYIRHLYMDTPLVSSAVQVVVGGGLVFAVGILIGSS
ncbi:MAG: hypothetical protein WB987_18195 [Candidatus Acidiferrales bacterium]